MRVMTNEQARVYDALEELAKVCGHPERVQEALEWAANRTDPPTITELVYYIEYGVPPTTLEEAATSIDSWDADAK